MKFSLKAVYAANPKKFWWVTGSSVVVLAILGGGGTYAYIREKNAQSERDRVAREQIDELARLHQSAEEAATKRKAEQDAATAKEQERIAAIENPVFSVYQEGKLRFLVYKTEEKKMFELASTYLTNDDQNAAYEISSSYSSAANAIVYTTGRDMYKLEVASGKVTRLAQGKELEGARDDFGGQKYYQRYYNPTWSPDGSKIAYNTSGFMSMTMAVMDASGNDLGSIKDNLYGTFAWSPDSKTLAIGSSDGMATSAALYTVPVDGKVGNPTRLLPENTQTNISDVTWSEDGATLFVNTYEYNEKTQSTKYATGTIPVSGGKVTTIVTDTNSMDFMVSGGSGTYYYYKSNVKDSTPIGIFKIQGAEATSFFTYENRPVLPIDANATYLLVKSPFNAKNMWDSPSSVLLVNRESKEVTSLGEARYVSQVGFIPTRNLPANLAVSETPKLTEKETADYKESLKTSTSLYQTYYDHCWDYDCASKVYPYGKLATSTRPEVVKAQTPPALRLKGSVEIPVVFMYVDQIQNPGYIDLVSNSDQAGSIPSWGTWLNNQAKAAGQDLNVSFGIKKDPIKLNDLCVSTYDRKYQTNEGEKTEKVNSLDGNCLKLQLTKQFPDLASKNVWQVYVQQQPYQAGKTPMYLSYQDSYVVDGVTMSVTNWNNYNGSLDFYKQSMYDQQAMMRSLLKVAGARNLTSYQSEGYTFSGEVSCQIDDRYDLMCGQWVVNRGATSGVQYKSATFADATIGEVTRKYLGWWDGDGDKVNEVADECPFDGKNACVRQP